MKTLITGGCGFIGSHLAEALVARGDEVVVIDNLATGRRSNLDRVKAKVRVVEGSIEDAALVDRTFGELGPDTVIHAAAAYKDPHAWVVDTMTNGVGGVNVIQAARAAKVKRIVYFQTALCYGNAPREQPVTLAHPRYPDCSYAISKTTSTCPSPSMSVRRETTLTPPCVNVSRGCGAGRDGGHCALTCERSRSAAPACPHSTSDLKTRFLVTTTMDCRADGPRHLGVNRSLAR